MWRAPRLVYRKTMTPPMGRSGGSVTSNCSPYLDLRTTRKVRPLIEKLGSSIPLTYSLSMPHRIPSESGQQRGQLAPCGYSSVGSG